MASDSVLRRHRSWPGCTRRARRWSTASTTSTLVTEKMEERLHGLGAQIRRVHGKGPVAGVNGRSNVTASDPPTVPSDRHPAVRTLVQCGSHDRAMRNAQDRTGGTVPRRLGVSRLDLFGSAATGAFKPESSDFDFLVECDPVAIGEARGPVIRVPGSARTALRAPRSTSPRKGPIQNPYSARLSPAAPRVPVITRRVDPPPMSWQRRLGKLGLGPEGGRTGCASATNFRPPDQRTLSPGEHISQHVVQ